MGNALKKKGLLFYVVVSPAGALYSAPLAEEASSQDFSSRCLGLAVALLAKMQFNLERQLRMTRKEARIARMANDSSHGAATGIKAQCSTDRPGEA